MSYSHEVAYVLKNEDYLALRKELDYESLEFISFADRSELFTASVCSNSQMGEKDELLILLYWQDVNHWGEGRTALLAKKLNETVHDHVIIGEDTCDVESCARLSSGILTVKNKVVISVPESHVKENLSKLFTQRTD